MSPGGASFERRATFTHALTGCIHSASSGADRKSDRQARTSQDDQDPRNMAGKRENAAAWLAKELADGRWHELGALKARAATAGIALRTLQRARAQLGTESRRSGAGTEWRVPAGATPNADEQTSLPPVPSHLSNEGKVLWRSVVSEFELSPAELRLLRLAIEALDRAEQARAVLSREGITYPDRWGKPRVRPEVAVERDARQAAARILQQLDIGAETSGGRD